MTVTLRPYQHKAVEDIEHNDNPCLVAPTGSGKTEIASAVIERAVNKHVLFIAHRRELVFQPRDRLAKFGVQAGVILAGQPMDQMRRVQIATVQTFHSRYIRGGKDLPPVDIIFIDECHHAPASTYRGILDAYPNAKRIGLTATPCRHDGRGLGSDFDTLVECPQIEELIQLEHLVRTRVFIPFIPDLKGVHVRQGDYVSAELQRIMDHNGLVADIVTEWHKHNPEDRPRRKTVVFTVSVAHSIHIMEEFVKSGVKAAHIDGKTDKTERAEILARLSSGDLELVTNCMVLTEGWDQPDVSCLVLARPTKSMVLFRQMVGRGLRPSPGKTDCLVLDHAGATLMHGRVEDPITWSLDPDTKAVNHTHAARGTTAAAKLLACTQCNALRTAGKPCTECGFMPQRQGEHLHVHDGELAELGRERIAFTMEVKREWHGMLTWIRNERGRQHGWIAHSYKAKFGVWPQGNAIPIPPSAEVRAWVRHRDIAFANSRQKAVA